MEGMHSSHPANCTLDNMRLTSQAIPNSSALRMRCVCMHVFTCMCVYIYVFVRACVGVSKWGCVRVAVGKRVHVVSFLKSV